MNFKRIIAIFLIVLMLITLRFFWYDVSSKYYANDTSLGNIYLGGELQDKTDDILTVELNKFIKNLKVKLFFNNETFELEKNFIDINLSETLNSITAGKDNLLFSEINLTNLENQIILIYGEKINSEIDYIKLEKYVKYKVASLDEEIIINLADYFTDFENLYQEVNYFKYEMDNTYAFGLNNIKIEIDGKKEFSLLDAVKNLDLNERELDILGTGITNLVIDTNFVNLRRENSNLLPNEINSRIIAYETDISKIHKQDLIFYNPNDYTYTIEINRDTSNVEFILKGIPFRIKYGHRIEKVEIPYTILEWDSEQEVENGYNGLLVKIYRYEILEDLNINSQLISSNFYRPEVEFK